MIPINNLHLIDNDPIYFYEYLEKNPNLYDNVSGLTDTEKAFLNLEFWDLKVKPAQFSHHYLHEIDKYIDQYLALKEIQFADKLNELTTNERLRTIINAEASNLARTSNRTHSSNGTDSESVTVHGNTKQADRVLPMNSEGEDLDDIVDWSKGASNAGESKTHNTNTVTGSNNVSGTDALTLSDIGSRNANGSITDKEMNDQAVTCIERIWNYLIQPKALEWLCNQLRPCFILSL